ncbi:Alpha/Beta hydrolase protein [Mycena latifolia]|nr:Alpha/Beta hydrolase protein [Mycena latifolia]
MFAGNSAVASIVLIHGLSVPALVWAPLLPQLVAAGHRVLLYDLYGRGYSDAPSTTYDAQLYVTQLALLLQHVGWARARVVGVSMGGGIAAAFVATFPDLVEDEVVLIASGGLLESSDLSRTSKVMSSPVVQALTANPLVYAYLRRLAARPDPSDTPHAGAGPAHELVRLQSAYLRGFNRAVSSSLRAGPVSGLRWAFEKADAWAGRRVLIVHGTHDTTVPPAHVPRIRALLEGPRRRPQGNETTRPPAVALTWTHAREVGGAVLDFLAGGGRRAWRSFFAGGHREGGRFRGRRRSVKATRKARGEPGRDALRQSEAQSSRFIYIVAHTRILIFASGGPGGRTGRFIGEIRGQERGRTGGRQKGKSEIQSFNTLAKTIQDLPTLRSGPGAQGFYTPISSLFQASHDAGGNKNKRDSTRGLTF